MTQTAPTDPRDAEPVLDGTSLMAYLHVLKKAHGALVGHVNAQQRFRQIVTRGHAKQYIEELMPQLLREREKHRQHRRRATGR
ncbi:hypothetical protein [Paraburkholderia humisilvae]|uniref:Uncharacterized protein n=1 Tax=Paraburkholderia humisilvae TaxID=627669 RepID=A0A6J5EQJ8_9BURK|nr:hypothetical protein [Paraburkholderia humisilvae]CAB3768164.1 hypothetical protein LMG29542_05789 [Paraburkholderia humisilvae]